jgi:hypothetical protein
MVVVLANLLFAKRNRALGPFQPATTWSGRFGSATDSWIGFLATASAVAGPFNQSFKLAVPVLPLLCSGGSSDPCPSARGRSTTWSRASSGTRRPSSSSRPTPFSPSSPSRPRRTTATSPRTSSPCPPPSTTASSQRTCPSPRGTDPRHTGFSSHEPSPEAGRASRLENEPLIAALAVRPPIGRLGESLLAARCSAPTRMRKGCGSGGVAAAALPFAGSVFHQPFAARPRQPGRSWIPSPPFRLKYTTKHELAKVWV